MTIPKGCALFFLGFLTLFCFFFQAPAFSENNDLSELENEVVLAKEKQKSIVDTLDRVELAFDEEKSKRLQAEAERLMADLATQTPAQEKEEVKNQIEKEIKLEVKKEQAKPSKKPRLEVPAIAKKPKKFWDSYKINYKTVNLTEGDAAYKVAVSDGRIDVKEAVRIGVANRVELKASQQRIEVAKGRLTEARRALFPTVQGVIENYRGLSGQIGARNTGLNAGANDPHGRYFRGRSYKLNVSQPIFYDGELINTMRQAEANLKVAECEYEKLKGEYQHQVKVAYYGVVKAEYNAQYQAELYTKVRELYQKMRAAHDLKLVPEIDYLNGESLYQQVIFQADAAQNDLISSKLTLSQTLGFDEEKDLPVDLRLSIPKLRPSLPELVEAAMKTNPDILLRSYGFEAATYGVKVFRSKKLPKFDLRGSYGMLGETFKDEKAVFEEGDNAQLDLEKEWFLGVESSMPLGPNSLEVTQNKRVFGPTVIQLTGTEDRKTRVAFNLLDKLGEITDEKEAQAVLLEAQSDLDKAKSDANVKIRENYYTLQKQMIQVNSASARIRYQEKQSKLTEYMMGLQEATAAGAIEGLISYAESRFSFIESVAEYHLAVSNLGLAVGDPEYFETDLVVASEAKQPRS